MTPVGRVWLRLCVWARRWGLIALVLTAIVLAVGGVVLQVRSDREDDRQDLARRYQSCTQRAEGTRVLNGNSAAFRAFLLELADVSRDRGLRGRLLALRADIRLQRVVNCDRTYPGGRAESFKHPDLVPTERPRVASGR